ncbi:hypothetical protein B0H11DRAFT_1229835 [Mycena galericulata]|nr:hypothetical protein B0H11DRAFT_1229835 [Mycena galericulata]
MSLMLPPETWLCVFEYVPDMYLQRVHAVSRLFRDISGRILFKETRFIVFEDPADNAPYEAGYFTHPLHRFQLHNFPASGWRISSLQRELQKIEFWTSPEIVLQVRKCSVTFQPDASIVPDSPSTLVSAYFKAIPKFLRLQEFGCYAGNPEPHNLLRLLGALPYLKRLHIHSNLVRPTEPTSIKLKIDHFSFTSLPNDLVENTQSYLSFIDPTTLRSLAIHASSIPSVQLGIEGMAMPSFHNLHVLEISFFNVNFTELHACLSPFPAIRDLDLEVRGSCLQDGLPATALAPHLRRYTGPCVLVPVVLCHTTDLQEITIATAGGFAPDLLLALQKSGGGVGKLMESLSMSIKYGDLSGSMLSEILAFFPRLVALTLHIYSETPSSSYPQPSRRDCALALFNRLTKPFNVPGALENIILNWWRDKQWEDVVPDVVALKAALVSGVPSLKNVSFGGHWKIASCG